LSGLAALPGTFDKSYGFCTSQKVKNSHNAQKVQGKLVVKAIYKGKKLK